MQYDYHVVDVFTQTPLQGNALAVFPDARGLEDAVMGRIARELNLSETTFVLPPLLEGAAARVRIFTPAYELKFAGHPTLGTAFVLRQLGMVAVEVSHFVLEEGVGAVKVRVESSAQPMLWLETPRISRGRDFDRVQCARAVGLTEGDLLGGIPCRSLSAGNPTLFVALKDKAAVDRARTDSVALRALWAKEREPSCMFVFTPTPEGAYSRMFAEQYGIVEDPATGSSTGPLAAFMMEYGLAPHADGTRFVSEQGTRMGRRSLLHVYVRGEFGKEAIEIGGHVTPLVVARMTLEV